MTEHVIEAHVAVPSALELGESARWLDGAFHWVDIVQGRVFRWSGRPGDAPHETAPGGVVTALFSDAAGGVGHVVDGTMRTSTGLIATLPMDVAVDGRTNDARIDSAGRAWIGTLGRGADARAATLWRVDDEGVHRVREGLTLSNGIDFAGPHLAYHVDTFDRVVWRYRLDDRGDIVDAEEFVRVEGALPDGLCVDADGGVWIALWGGGAVERYDVTGRRTHVVGTPGASQATSLCLGGAGLRDLLITTACEGVDETSGGAVFAARTEIPGVAEHAWQGLTGQGREGERHGS